MARNAVLSFGLVNVPVGVETAAKRKDITFRTLHRSCGGSLNQQMFCAACGEVVSNGDTVKGYEVSKGQFLNFEPEEIEAAKGTRSSQIMITKFVKETTLDVITFDTTYWLKQHETLKEPYVLLMNSLSDNEAIGIGQSHLWGKDYPVAVWTDRARLYLTTLFCVEDMRDMDAPEQVDVSRNIDLARELIAAMMDDLDEGDLRSPEREKMNRLIAARMAGQEFQPPAEVEPSEPTIDIQAKLRESIEKAKSRTAA